MSSGSWLCFFFLEAWRTFVGFFFGAEVLCGDIYGAWQLQLLGVLNDSYVNASVVD